MGELNWPIRAGNLADILYRSIRTGGKSLDNIPGVVNQLLKNDIWKIQVCKQTGELIEFDRFIDFITTEPPEGLGTTYETLLRLIPDNETQSLLDDAVKKGDGAPMGNTNNRYSKSTTLYNVQGCTNKESDSPKAPTGNTKQAGLRRLRKHRPDLLEEVINEKLSVNAAMIEAGLRKKSYQIVTDPVKIANKLLEILTDDQIQEVIQLLNEKNTQKIIKS